MASTLSNRKYKEMHQLSIANLHTCDIKTTLMMSRSMEGGNMYRKSRRPEAESWYAVKASERAPSYRCCISKQQSQHNTVEQEELQDLMTRAKSH